MGGLALLVDASRFLFPQVVSPSSAGRLLHQYETGTNTSHSENLKQKCHDLKVKCKTLYRAMFRNLMAVVKYKYFRMSHEPIEVNRMLYIHAHTYTHIQYVQPVHAFTYIHA